jgi:hypothetical protein
MLATEIIGARGAKTVCLDMCVESTAEEVNEKRAEVERKEKYEGGQGTMAEKFMVEVSEAENKIKIERMKMG